MPHPYTIVHGEDGRRTLTLFVSGEPFVVAGDHPHFDRLVEAAQDGADAAYVRDLADASLAVATKFEGLSERVTVAHGRLYFDGDELDNALAKHILRCLEDPDIGDWRPLVRFMERLAANPNRHSREQLFDWLDRRSFTVSRDGYIVAYKGVRSDFTSITRGPAIVDGERVNGNVPNRPGSVVEIARSAVAFDPSQGCASGLHAGSYEYASSFARGALLKVLVDPRDVVSVPTDSDWAKVRTCRYKVVERITAPETAPIDYSESWDGLCECGEVEADECGCF